MLKALFIGNEKSGVEKFLDDADNALEQAIKLKNPNIFKDYCSPRFMDKLAEMIYAREDFNFGLKDYRTRTWEIKESGEGDLRCIKIVKHKPMRVTKTLSIPVADDTEESWRVIYKPGEVLDIELCE